MKYIVYGQPECNFCTRARNLLITHDKPLSYINIRDNPEARSFLIDEEGHKTVPQVYRRGALGILEYIGGYEDLQEHLQQTQ